MCELIFYIMEKFIKVAIIGPSRINLYREKIQKELNEISAIIYCSRYHMVVDLVKDNPHLTFRIVTPNSFFDRVEKANDLAREIKNINPKSKVYSYSFDLPAEKEFIDVVMTQIKSKEDEIKNLISFLK